LLESGFAPWLQVRSPDDIVISKTTHSAHAGSDPRLVLRNMAIEHVVVAGIFTGQCVSSTVRSLADESFDLEAGGIAVPSATNYSPLGSGHQLTKPSRLGIFTAGSVRAFSSLSSAMMPFFARTKAVTA
jgi:hypothetical protein